MGVYVVHGLFLSPQMSMKFSSQKQDDINGNDFVKRCLGPAAGRCHKHFFRFFAVQNPITPTLDRSSIPNWKLEPF